MVYSANTERGYHIMSQKNRIVWKLSAVVIAIVSLVIIVFACVENFIGAHYSLVAARDILKFNTGSIARGIESLMMSRNNAGVETLLTDLSGDSEIYGDIRLLSHETGAVAASRLGSAGATLTKDDPLCALCHSLDQSALGGTDPRDMIFEDPAEGRRLSVVTPIANKETCRNADCHAHAGSKPILGFLQADYSLAIVDAPAASRNLYTILAALLTVLLSTAALWMMFRRILGRPIDGLIAGTRRLAEGDLEFRFPAERDDEIGELEGSFNTMTASIREHQTELSNAMEYLKGVIENSADIIITVTPRRMIQTFNRGAEQALGYSRDEVQGKRIEILFADPKDRDRAINQLQYSDNVRNFQTNFLTKGGEVRNVLLTLSRLRDTEGNSIGTFGISKDITEEKKLLREVIQTKKFAAIGQAVTGIQHAIKNMLNALKGGAYLVRNGMKTDNRQRLEEGWAMVEEGIERMSGLSLNMLNYAKDWKPDFEEADIKHLLSKVHEVVRQNAADNGVMVQTELPEVLAPVRCDPKLIHMAVMDIVSNAIDACTWKDFSACEVPEVVLRISPEVTPGSVAIEISDNGCGMSADVVKNVFTPFFSTKKKWGTGLGLALTLRVINVHGGTIKVDSKPNEGTTFRVVLPVRGPLDNKETVDGQEGSHN